MISSAFNIFLGIGGIFGFLAALMAYLITYNEWMHHYPTKKEPRKIALEVAIFTFIFFFSISLISGYFLTKYI
jgi:uncharacterized protein YybS (DUF2232 family)